jgi:hypothetical protein
MGAVAKRLPVPMPVVTIGAVALLVLVAVILVRIVGSDTASADKVAAPTQSTAPPATAAPAPAPTAPLATRPTALENAAARAAFIETMKRTGLTPPQADCVANRVETEVGWNQLTESLMDPGKPGQLKDFMIACVKR